MPEVRLNPKEVFDFLRILEKRMRESGRNASAEALHKASLFFRYPLTSEFYGEAMVALKQVSEGIDVLTDEDKTKAKAIAQAIKDQWFTRP